MVTFLDVSEQPETADAVLILPGSEDARPEKAAQLIQAEFAQIALIPETSRPTDAPVAPGFATTEKTRKVLLQRGVAASQIHVIDGLSTSTYGDAKALARYLQTSPLTDVIVLTDAWHSRRTQVAFQHALAGIPTKIHYCSVPNRFDKNSWWTDPSTRNGILKEWGKLLCYIVIYGHGWRWSVVLVLFCVTISAARRYANQCRAKEPKYVGVRN